MKRFSIVLILLIAFGCGKDSPKPPEGAILLFPLRNSECTTGENTNLANTSLVEFRWSEARGAETYELRATNLEANITQTISVSTTSAKLPLLKGAPYSWTVTSRTSAITQTARSETWLFYNAGFQTTYPPFPAEVIAPKSGASVSKDINNEVLLNWNGADVDNDITGYQVYFSTSNPPENLVASNAASSSQLRVSVSSQTIYYWRVITEDREGNTSDSGVYEFRVF